MLIERTVGGFTLVETLVALALMLAGLAGAGIVLGQSIQYERESPTVALPFAWRARLPKNCVQWIAMPPLRSHSMHRKSSIGRLRSKRCCRPAQLHAS